MAYQDIALGLVFDGADVGEAALTYAMSLVAPADGRLTSLLCVPWFEILGAPIIPLADAVVAQVNEERLGRAAAMKTTIESAATIQAFDAQVRILNERRGSVIKAFSEAIRLSDLCVLPRPAGEFGAMKDIVEAALFKSGRPVIIVPSDHIKPAEFGRIVVAWDGSAPRRASVDSRVKPCRFNNYRPVGSAILFVRKKCQARGCAPVVKFDPTVAYIRAAGDCCATPFSLLGTRRKTATKD
jgi:hypothetical protein